MAAGDLPMWRHVPPDVDRRLEDCLDAALAAAPGRADVFFRADDVAPPGIRLARLVRTFAELGMPLNLAVVPAWLTDTRWRTLRTMTVQAPALFCWHQHGWRHANHEPAGKRQEFGPARSREAIRTDVTRGKQRLTRIMGHAFCPVFTPPWNRCDSRTLAALLKEGFGAVSRTRPPSCPPVAGLAELPVTVDLHTRPPLAPAAAWRGLLAELGAGITGGRCGIMIHHQRMNDAAFGFLELLLSSLARRKRLRPVTFGDLLGEIGTRRP